VIGEAPPALTILTGSASVDDSPADGASANAATFVAQDQYGNPMTVPLDITATAGDVSAASITTDAATGSATVSVTSTTAGALTVTAVSLTLRADVSMTFTEVPAP
jgi:hypothetical protein